MEDISLLESLFLKPQDLILELTLVLDMHILIFMIATDTISQNEVYVTDAFTMTRYGGDSYTVSEVLEQYKTAEEAYTLGI